MSKKTTTCAPELRATFADSLRSTLWPWRRPRKRPEGAPIPTGSNYCVDAVMQVVVFFDKTLASHIFACESQMGSSDHLTTKSNSYGAFASGMRLAKLRADAFDSSACSDRGPERTSDSTPCAARATVRNALSPRAARSGHPLGPWPRLSRTLRNLRSPHECDAPRRRGDPRARDLSHAYLQRHVGRGLPRTARPAFGLRAQRGGGHQRVPGHARSHTKS